MKAVSHMLVGTTLYIGFVTVTGRPVSITELVAATVASLLPDIDHPKSAFGRVVPFISLPLAAVFGHRGITHSLLAAAAVGLVGLAYADESALATAIVIGYLSHLLADGLSNSGVPLMWPSKRKFALPLVKTGGFLEYLLMVSLGIVLVQYVLKNVRSLAW